MCMIDTHTHTHGTVKGAVSLPTGSVFFYLMKSSEGIRGEFLKGVFMHTHPHTHITDVFRGSSGLHHSSRAEEISTGIAKINTHTY